MDFGDFLYYDESSPSCLRWKIDRFKGKNYETPMNKAGDEAGSVSKNGYWRVGVNGKQYFAHRVVWFLLHGEMPHKVDHRDGDKLRNVGTNLRAASAKVNRRNVKKAKNNTSGVTGVTFCEKFVDGGFYQYFKATWRNADGTPKEVGFSVLKYGNEEAFRLACEYRARMIEELNAQGAGYTERHGT